MLTPWQRFQKRTLDLTLSILLLPIALPLIAIGWLAATRETKENGFYRQIRIGKNGKPFELLKIKTMKSLKDIDTTVTTVNDRRITRSGKIMRRLKIDELPQLFNVIKGEMSLVGPRPDVPGFADTLEGEDRIVLSVPPGITGPASLKYKNEEALLAQVDDPEKYNREVIWHDKVRINKKYVQEWSLKNDLIILWQTIKGDE